MAKRKKINLSKVLSRSILLFLCAYVVFTFYEQEQEMTYLQSLENANLERIQVLEDELADMQESIAQAHTSEYIEEIARRQLKMIGVGETLFIDIGNRIR